jgi:hypothetical protein
MEVENWLPVKDYEGHYEVSDLGRVRSIKFGEGKIRKKDRGLSNYDAVTLCKNCICKSKAVHKLVAIAFLNHVPDGHKKVINHINFDKLDNRLVNLEIISQRDNSNRKHITYTSKYVGVSLSRSSKWTSAISIDGKTRYLGVFMTELEAHNAYQEALEKITQ